MDRKEFTLDEYLPFGKIDGIFYAFKPYLPDSDSLDAPSVVLTFRNSEEVLFHGLLMTTIHESATDLLDEMELYAESVGRKAMYVDFRYIDHFSAVSKGISPVQYSHGSKEHAVVDMTIGEKETC